MVKVPKQTRTKVQKSRNIRAITNRAVRYDREGITYEEYCQLCSYFLKKGDYKHLVMTTFEWNLMCRVNQLNELTTTRP